MDTLSTKGITLRIPESMKAEHEELHTELYAATQAPGDVGAAAQRVADLLHEHFESEEEYALPPLGLLPALASGETGPELAAVLPLTERLKAGLPEMLDDHKAIVQALDALITAAEAAREPRFVRFAEKLKLHAQNEEEVAYPTAILIGEYVKRVLNIA